MRLYNALFLGFVASSLQLLPSTSRVGGALRISEYLTNYTHSARRPDIVNSLASAAGQGPPPPVPARPAPKPPTEPYLPLYTSASDEVWEKAKCKGANFVRAMRGSDKEAGSVFQPPRDSAASPFEDIADMDKWGWDMVERGINGDFVVWGVDRVLNELGISEKCVDKGGSIQCLTFVHGWGGFDDNNKWVSVDEQTYEVDGKTHRATGAHYGFGIEPSKGVIIAMDRNSPQSAGKERQPAVASDDLPAVRAFSDVAWLSWKNMADDIKDLNYFMSLSIGNPETAAIISRAIREVMPDARSFPEWGGHKFDTNTPQGQAILGTPNAQAFSYFLLQHKATLGNLYISQAQVFRDGRQKPGPCLLFVVKPVPAEVPADDKPEEPKHSQDAGDVNAIFQRTLRRYLRARL